MPANSSETVIAVFELRPYWGPELQRQFEHTSINVRECRNVGDLRLLAIGHRSGLFVIDFDSAPADCLGWLALQVTDHSFGWPIVACGSSDTAELEWLLREAGVAEFLSEPTNGDDFARLCRRLLGLSWRGRTVH